MSDNTILLRDTDRWIRKWSLIAPILAYVIGSVNGFVGAAWLYRDHEKRISKMEDILIAVVKTQTMMVTVLENNDHVNLH